mmetsp:Transcript_27365/g.69030  ORF Transcript_27365/g.69030 Transcript_27365/m.69030 type:complete len:258 (-) Transcript_27365:49-822(-)
MCHRGEASGSALLAEGSSTSPNLTARRTSVADDALLTSPSSCSIRSATAEMTRASPGSATLTMESALAVRTRPSGSWRQSSRALSTVWGKAPSASSARRARLMTHWMALSRTHAEASVRHGTMAARTAGSVGSATCPRVRSAFWRTSHRSSRSSQICSEMLCRSTWMSTSAASWRMLTFLSLAATDLTRRTTRGFFLTVSSRMKSRISLRTFQSLACMRRVSSATVHPNTSTSALSSSSRFSHSSSSSGGSDSPSLS